MAGPQFPADFLWGVSASAFQIEGGVAEGGRGRSSWDTFCATPGKIANEENADVACDHFHRYPEDVALMAGLGVDAYRLSFSWPRIQPDGIGLPNAEGIGFYDRLLDELCEAGITPVGTLYHWDTPQPLEDMGGWRNRETALRFGEYARIAGERFADRVPMWIPVNEPMVTSIYGYAIGQYAPGEFLLLDALPTAHHQNLAHGLAVQALRALGVEQVGTANNHGPVWPAGPDDGAAADAMDALVNRLFADPVLLGTYPEQYTRHLPEGFAEDLPVIASPIDFYGVNYYEPQLAASPSPGNPLPFDLVPVHGYPMTTNDSPIVPGALTELLIAMRDRYGDALPPIQITENGCSFADEVGLDGRVRDNARIDFLEAHLKALADAMTAGVDVRGYFVWSILDNFEWSKGYAPRFGLVHVDFKTLERTPKDSYGWYRDLIASTR